MGESTLKKELLNKYVTFEKTFVETGTAQGNGVQVALDYGFQKIVTIEVNPKMYFEATQRFALESNVLLMLGGSRDVLPHVLKDIKEPAVFWLDAHWSTGEAPLPPGTLPCPVLAELRALAKHPIKDHLIMMDDIRYYKHGIEQWQNINLGDIIDELMRINPKYWITFEPGITDSDILIAKVI